jgi:hypothetical protein
MSVNMSAEAVDRRLHQASDASQPLTAATRLDCKIDLSAHGVSARLREASELLDVCRALAQSARDAGLR